MNKIHHANFLDNDLPDGCAKLIIADPPYFEVKGKFDFIWKSFDDYLKDVEKWAQECTRILAENGTLFWWGMDRKIAYSQVIIDKYLNLLSTLVWEKPSNPNEWDTRRTFPERGAERLLMYSKDWDINGLEAVESDPNNYKRIKEYLREQVKLSGQPFRYFTEITSTYAGHYFALSSQWAFPTEKDYKAFQENTNCFKMPYEELRKEYEELRKEYEEQRRYFNNYLKLTDVLKYSQQSGVTRKYDHPTQKPEKLTRALIQTTTRKGDLIVVPFAGSGTECAMSADLQRPFIGYDIDEKHVRTARKRCEVILRQPKLF